MNGRVSLNSYSWYEKISIGLGYQHHITCVCTYIYTCLKYNIIPDADSDEQQITCSCPNGSLEAIGVKRWKRAISQAKSVVDIYLILPSDQHSRYYNLYIVYLGD